MTSTLTPEQHARLTSILTDEVNAIVPLWPAGRSRLGGWHD